METLNLTGLKCPRPSLRAQKALATMDSGTVSTVLADDAGAPDDLAAFCKHTGHELLERSETAGVFKLVIRRK